MDRRVFHVKQRLLSSSAPWRRIRIRRAGDGLEWRQFHGGFATPLQPMPKELTVRCEVVFRGHVQGVGFRFTTTNVASRFAVVGYVLNRSDGTVCMVAEGLRKDVSAMIHGVLGAMAGYVTGHQEDWKPATGEFRDFSVRYEIR